MTIKHPNHISSLSFQDLVNTTANIDGKWVPARPMPFISLARRFKLAWWVFTGKADALTWFGQ